MSIGVDRAGFCADRVPIWCCGGALEPAVDGECMAILGAWANGDPLAGWNAAGIIDTQALVAFLGHWAAGCS